MALEIRQQLRQTQQLVMTPQLQQAIKLLQYNHLEMVEAVEQELNQNPILESISPDEAFSSEDSSERSDIKDLEALVKEPDKIDQEFSDADWENYLESYGSDYAPVDKDQNDRNSFENLPGASENLFNYLLSQLRLSRIEGEDRRIAFEIIGNLNEDGFLDIEVKQIAENVGTSEEDVERVLTEVQKFDPCGIAARDLRECLLIQAGELNPPNLDAIKILEEGFDLFRKGQLKTLEKKLKLSSEQIEEAFKSISTLELKPARPFIGENTVFVSPDIYIIKTGRDYSIVLNDDGMPRLRISPLYKKALHSNNSASVTKDYIQDKMRSAMWLIKSIHQRQRTIYKVAQSIIKFQRDFLDKGVDYLRPLILRDVADDVEMHESTISRVTTNKYVHTPQGIFELKYFFNSGIKHGADEIASESVKNYILKIVRNEDPKKPVSDKQIADELAKTQIHIARRTVAKYREMLGIPPSSRRKKKF
jgi:RNA polymerase sigma-54 factor